MPPSPQPGHKRNKAPGCPHPLPAPQPSPERTGNWMMLPKGERWRALQRGHPPPREKRGGGVESCPRNIVGRAQLSLRSAFSLREQLCRIPPGADRQGSAPQLLDRPQRHVPATVRVSLERRRGLLGPCPHSACPHALQKGSSVACVL